MEITDRYTGNDYLERYPEWHVADSGWKCDRILEMLGPGDEIRSVCEVGCGAGEILRQLHDRRPTIEHLVGYEISEPAMKLATSRATDRLSFRLGDAAEDEETFDLTLIMDVIEHVADPIEFLSRLRFKAKQTIIHIPLDLSAQAVLRPRKLTTIRHQAGHLHYFTLETALAVVTEAGYTVRHHFLTESFEQSAKSSVLSRLALLPRRLVPPMVAARALGGYSVLVAADNSRPTDR